MVTFPYAFKINIAVVLTTLNLPGQSTSELPVSLMKSDSKEQFRDCLKNTTGHLSILSCIGSHNTGNFHLQLNQCTCCQALEMFHRGNALIDMNDNNFALQILRIERSIIITIVH